MRHTQIWAAAGAALFMCAAAVAPAAGQSSGGAATPAFGFPIACAGDGCIIQRYVDLDAGPGVADPNCGPAAGGEHKGTDFRVATFAEMRAGVDILAPAEGVVIALRDGEPDRIYDGAADLGGKDCGNGVVIDHGGGWTSQLCHLKNGSVRPSVGDRVARGETVGAMGLSGKTQFPHVHVTFRDGDRVIDPFSGRAIGEGCGPSKGGLWAEPLAYRGTRSLESGFWTAAPDVDRVRDGGDRIDRLPRSAPALVFWARVIALHAGDVMRIELIAPTGALIAENEVTLERPRARQFLFTGRRLRGAAWPPGAYRGRVVVRRDGRAIFEEEAAIATR